MVNALSKNERKVLFFDTMLLLNLAISVPDFQDNSECWVTFIVILVEEVVTPVNKVKDKKVEREKNSTSLVNFNSTSTESSAAARHTAS